MNSFGERLVSAAHAVGFGQAAVIDIEPTLKNGFWVPAAIKRYQECFAAGSLKALPYLERNTAKIADPLALLAEARAMLIVAFEYPGFHPVKKTARHAAFLNGPDYHVVIGEKLEQIAKATLAEGAAYKVCVDSSALLEKAWAADAGLGWIGKHGLLINPDVGSRVLLGELLVTELVDSGPVVSEELCGECSRCLSACPTRALLGPGLLEVAKCISFATLEDRSGRLSVSRPEDRGVWVAGCDVCQDVCPHNEKAVCTSHRLERDWTTLLLETDEAYRARVRGTALERVKFSQYRRNLETAVRNK